MIVKSTFTVVLEAEGEESAEFVFRKPKANKILTLQEDKEDVKKNFFMLTDDLVSVKGLWNDYGKEITVDNIKELDLDYTTITAIIEGYTAGAFPKKEENAEKKLSLVK